MSPREQRAFIDQQIVLMHRPICAVMLLSALLFLATGVADLLPWTEAQHPGWWRAAWATVLLAGALAFRRLRSRGAQLVLAIVFLLALSSGIALSVLLVPARLPYSLAAFVLLPVVLGALWTRGRLLPLVTVAWLAPAAGMLLMLDGGMQAWLAYGMYLAIGIAIGEVLRRLRLRASADIFVLRRELERRATSDALTGVLNRAGWNRIADRVLADARDAGRPLALVFFDLDRFKSINDRHGHAVGDHVLERAAAFIRSGLRVGDPLARFGGEEFVALLPSAERDGAVRVAERIRLALEAAHLKVPVTLSAGIALLRDDDTLDALLHAADDALRDAKQGGRNRVVLAARERDPGAATPPAAATPTRTRRRPGSRSRTHG